MSWLFFALIGHTANGAAFIIDKALLSSSFKRSATYAAMIGGLSLIVVLAAPAVKQWPSTTLLPFVIAFGALFVVALWAFFEALKRGEATRVVPIVGSLIPMITLLGTMTLFNERLSAKQLAGFVILLASTWLLTIGKSSRALSGTTIMACLIAATLFAISTLFGKYSFDHSDFLGVFVSSRIAAGVTGLTIAFLVPAAGREALSVLRSQKHPKHPHRHSGAWAVVGQTLGACGFLFVHLAIKNGSASIVNALQAIQYALLVIAALILRDKAPKLLNEKLDRKTLVIKLTALAMTGLGLALVV